MFTGIVAGRGKIIGRRTAGGGVVLDLEASFPLPDPQEGESIAVAGVCLTAYALHDRTFRADVSPETLARTKLGGFRTGAMVNLERALRAGDRFGGHIVSGHIDCLATVTSRNELGSYTLFTFSLPSRFDRYLIEKGSVALDGVSLTVNSTAKGEFSVSIIPHTLMATTLAALQVGEKVNVEVDLIGKYVEKLLAPRSQDDGEGEGVGLNLGFLAKHGYL